MWEIAKLAFEVALGIILVCFVAVILHYNIFIYTQYCAIKRWVLQQIRFSAWPVLLCLLCCAAVLTLLIGKALQNKISKFSLLARWKRPSLPISAVCKASLIILAADYITYVVAPIPGTLLIVDYWPENVKYKMRTYHKKSITATVLGQYP